METSEVCIFASQLRTRALSSAGSERLPYKQRVGGSNPSAPTLIFPFQKTPIPNRALSSAGSERLPYKQRVGGSNPSAPTLIFPFQKTPIPNRALSSAGSERLPYKQRVGGSNPSAPTTKKQLKRLLLFLYLPHHCFFLAQKSLLHKGRGRAEGRIAEQTVWNAEISRWGWRQRVCIVRRRV